MTARLMANNFEDVNYGFSLVVVQTYTVGICEEANTGDNCESNMVPAKRSLIDFREGHAPSLIWVRDVCLCMLETTVVYDVVGQRTYTPGTSRYAALPTRPNDGIWRVGAATILGRYIQSLKKPHPGRDGVAED